MKDIPSEDLRMYVVWLPILRSDDRFSAYLRSPEYKDDRVSYFWDDDQLTGIEWADVIDYNQVAWDIYFLYGKDTPWDESPSKPDYWMHQLGQLQDKALFLNGDTLVEEIEKLLAKN